MLTLDGVNVANLMHAGSKVEQPIVSKSCKGKICNTSYAALVTQESSSILT